MIELLKGVRVLECAVLMTGDQTGRLLGDLGAEIIKVEAPGTGDYIRVLGDMLAPDNSSTHLMANRHKRSLTLNLRSEEGRQIFFEILKGIDIFVDGFAGDACKRLGIGYEEQCKVKPDIIYLQANGYGNAGPYRQIPVHGYMLNATAGSSRLRVREDGLVDEVMEVDDEIHFPGYPDGPMMGGLFAAYTAVAALNHRRATGKGVYIDTAGADSVLAEVGMDANNVWNRARAKRPENTAPSPGQDPRSRPKYAFYQTRDKRFVLLAAIEPKFWNNFCKAVDRPDLASVQYADSPVDFRNIGGRKDLPEELRDIFASHTQAEWVELASRYDIALGPANTLEETQHDPHLSARDIVHKTVHPVAGAFTTIGWPAMVSGQRFGIEQHAPALGEHTDEVLTALGHSKEEVRRLRERGIV